MLGGDVAGRVLCSTSFCENGNDVMLGHVHVNFASLFLGYSTDSVTDFSVYSV